MFFLLRMAFWLTIVLALLPSGSSQPGAQAKVGTTDAVVAASAAVSDMSGFCDRQPEACVVGAQTATMIAQRAQAGAKMVYEFINQRIVHGETGSVPERKVAAARDVPPSTDSQSTLKGIDVESTWLNPTWQGRAARDEAVPLPRKDPRRGA